MRVVVYLVGVGAGEVEVGDGGSLLRAEDIHAWGLTVERLAQLHHVRPRALQLPVGGGGRGLRRVKMAVMLREPLGRSWGE